MTESLNLLTLVCKFKHTVAAEIVYLKSFQKWVGEIDASSAVDHDVNFRCYHGAVLWAHSKLVNDEVTCNRDNSVTNFLSQGWVLSESWEENL